MWGFQNSLFKNFEIHSGKKWESSIFMYSIRDKMMWGFQKSLSKKIEKLQFFYLLFFVINDVRISKIIVEKFWKKINSNVFYYFVMKWCEDFKNHCWKFWKSSILMYLIILWWNEVRISKIIVDNFFNVYVFSYSVMKCCEDFKNQCWLIQSYC